MGFPPNFQHIQQFIDDEGESLFLGTGHGSITGHPNPKDRVWCGKERMKQH